MKNGLLLDWATIGATLANSGDDDQAAFFKSFVKEMRTWPTRHQAEMQLMSVRSKLTEQEREDLSALTYKPASH